MVLISMMVESQRQGNRARSNVDHPFDRALRITESPREARPRSGFVGGGAPVLLPVLAHRPLGSRNSTITGAERREEHVTHDGRLRSEHANASGMTWGTIS